MHVVRQLNPMSRLLIVCLSASLAVGPALAQRQGMFPEPVAGDAHTGSPDLSGGGHSLPPTNGGGMAPSLNGGGMTPTIRSLDPRPAAQQPPQGPQPPEARQQTLPPNDFQRFVLETSGQALPLYGLTFFNQATATYVPQGNVPVSPDYRMGPGDEVQIRGWGSVDIDVRTTVDRDGLIHIPRVGKVNLSGIRSAQAEDVVRAAVGKYYKDFQLSVTLGQLKGITVYVVGQARKPGSYTLGSTSTLVSALFASGGPNQNGSMRRVQVKRGDKVVTELDLYAFLAKGDKAADIRLQDGDTIVIPPAKGFVALSGKVTNAAVFELAREGETLGAMLAVAGGLPVVADPKRAQLDRVDPSKKPARSVDVFALDAKGLSTPLKSGDILTVSELVPEFGNAVTLRGNVAQATRSPWKANMRITDLIPSRAFLMSRASVKRQNDVLLSEEDKRNASSDAFARLAETDPQKSGQKEKPVGDSADTLASRIGNLVDEINMDYAVVERVDAAKVSVQLIPFSLANALENPSGPDNLVLQPGDIVTVFSVNDVRVPQAKRRVFVRVEGEVHRPGVYQMKPGDGLQQLITQAGGVTPDAYLFGAAFYREEVRRTQITALKQLVDRMESQVQSRLSTSAANVSGGESAGVAQLRLQAEIAAQKEALQRLRELKPTGRIQLGLGQGAQPDQLPHLKLESQDRLVVPSRPDFVYVLGSVNTESSLIWREGSDVQDYLDLSGLTGGADLDELFVIRADGSVLSNAGARWFSSVRGAKVMPGDVIVLPEKTNRESAWSVFTRNAKDITQIIYQFSLGAAAIKTLRD